MVRRIYCCDKCDYNFETFQPMMEELLKTCPECKKDSLFQDLSGINCSIKQYNTIGSLAEKNTKALGTYGRQAKEEELKKQDQAIIDKRVQDLEKHGYRTLKKRK